MKDSSRSIHDQRDIDQQWSKARAKKFGSVHPSVPELSERAWAAGFFDGEGSVSGEQGKGVWCSIEQTVSGARLKDSEGHRDTRSIGGELSLERFRRIVGVGEIRDRSGIRGEEYQPTKIWRTTSQEDVSRVYAVIGEFIGPAKRQQFAAALRIPVETALKHDNQLPKGYLSIETKPTTRGDKDKA